MVREVGGLVRVKVVVVELGIMCVSVPNLGSRIWGQNRFSAPGKSMSSYFLLQWGVQILCLLSQNQTPRSDSANLEPSEPIFYPQILEPSPKPLRAD